MVRGRIKTEAERAFDQHTGDRIRAIRQERGLTQDELASAIEVSRGTVNLMEQGRVGVSAYKMRALMQALDCRESDLVGAGSPTTLQPPLVTVHVRTRHPEDYELINHADDTHWRIEGTDGQARWALREEARQ